MLCRKGNVDKALVLVNWPAGHFVFGGSSHHTPTKPVAMRYGLRVAAPSPHQEAMAAAYSITCTAVTPTNDWITDRRPTEADGDSDGDVLARYHPDDDDYAYLHWSYVGAGVPWRHDSDWQPPAPTKPALAVGQRWRRRDGAVVTVDKINRNHQWGSTHPFWAGWHSYTPEGANQADGVLGNSCDLIELISKPEPTPTPRKFASITRTFTEYGCAIDAIDEDGVAWWMTPATHDSEPEWHQLTPLPGREVVG